MLEVLDAFPTAPGVPGLWVARPGYRYGEAANGRVTATEAVILAMVPDNVVEGEAAAKAFEAKYGVP